MDCGARNRFVVLTEGGVIIAHNSGYAGWIGAWKNFGADKFFSDDEIKKLIVAWRDASPSIPEFWGGQVRGFPWNPTRFEYYGLEGAMVQAIMNPNQCFMTHGISFGMRDDAVFVRLPSGRILTYHRPRLTPNPKYEGQFEISYEGWNSNALMGAVGWFRMSTYGGKLCENIVQAVSRDIMAYAVNNLERAGYDVVIRVHDEIVAEIEEGSGNIEEFERIMATLPPWATGMPVRASGGWIGKRYRKD
jgi:DNA polymerase